MVNRESAVCFMLFLCRNVEYSTSIAKLLLLLFRICSYLVLLVKVVKMYFIFDISMLQTSRLHFVGKISFQALEKTWSFIEC